MNDGHPDYQEILDGLASRSTASREAIEKLLDVEAIRDEHEKVTEEALRRHIASVEQVHRMFGEERDND